MNKRMKPCILHGLELTNPRGFNAKSCRKV